MNLLDRQDRELLEAWLVGADFPMAPIVRRLIVAYDEREESLAILRAAWNHHMDGCEQVKALPTNEPPDELTMERIREWMTAPSNTASADPSSDATRNDGDEKCPACGWGVSDCVCIRRASADWCSRCGGSDPSCYICGQPEPCTCPPPSALCQIHGSITDLSQGQNSHEDRE